MVTIADYVRHRKREKASTAGFPAGSDVLFDDFQHMEKRRRWASFEEYTEWQRVLQAYSFPDHAD